MHVTSATAASRASFSSGRLVRGAAGAAVRQLQAMLKDLGLYSGNIGGNFGPLTDAAVRAFQRKHGLKVDGWAGPKTMAALQRVMQQPGKVTAPGSSPVSSFTPAAGATGAGAPAAGIAGMLDWAKSKVGTPYAAVNPFRFGDVPWDGRAHRSVNGSGSTYQYPRGTQVFDCSGFVVAAYRKLGIDLAAKGLASSWAIHANAGGFLQNIDPSQLRPGDLVTYKPKNGVGHVVIYLGDGKMVQASGGKGVNVADLDWSRVQSARRVPVP